MKCFCFVFTNLHLPHPSRPHSFPSRFLIGRRSRAEATADRRRDELNGYVWHLIHAAPEVAQVLFHSQAPPPRPGYGDIHMHMHRQMDTLVVSSLT